MTTSTQFEYATLAGLFFYPDERFGKRVREIQTYLDGACTAAAAQLVAFTEFAENARLVDLEELYTRSFDVQAVTTLDVGYVLFGDDYKRGELLVNLSRELAAAGVDGGTELPDHLPNVLRLLDVIADTEVRAELVKKILGPALRKIIAEFDPARIEKKNSVYKKHHRTLIERSENYGVIYARTVQALYTVLQQEFDVGVDEETFVPHHSKFLNSIGTEMTLECNKGKS